jgi:FKBP-type peptidyl-prolyl cis-trans isomerase
MPKRGIKILTDLPGEGRPLVKGDRVRIRYSIQLNHGEYLARDEEAVFTIGNRNQVAGFRYGLEGMRVGGYRCFKASPHLCYHDRELEHIPKNAVLIFEIRSVEIVA